MSSAGVKTPSSPLMALEAMSDISSLDADELAEFDCLTEETGCNLARQPPPTSSYTPSSPKSSFSAGDITASPAGQSSSTIDSRLAFPEHVQGSFISGAGQSLAQAPSYGLTSTHHSDWSEWSYADTQVLEGEPSLSSTLGLRRPWTPTRTVSNYTPSVTHGPVSQPASLTAYDKSPHLTSSWQASQASLSNLEKADMRTEFPVLVVSADSGAKEVISVVSRAIRRSLSGVADVQVSARILSPKSFAGQIGAFAADGGRLVVLDHSVGHQLLQAPGLESLTVLSILADEGDASEGGTPWACHIEDIGNTLIRAHGKKHEWAQAYLRESKLSTSPPSKVLSSSALARTSLKSVMLPHTMAMWLVGILGALSLFAMWPVYHGSLPAASIQIAQAEATSLSAWTPTITVFSPPPTATPVMVEGEAETTPPCPLFNLDEARSTVSDFLQKYLRIDVDGPVIQHAARAGRKVKNRVEELIESRQAKAIAAAAATGVEAAIRASDDLLSQARQFLRNPTVNVEHSLRFSGEAVNRTSAFLHDHLGSGIKQAVDVSGAASKGLADFVEATVATGSASLNLDPVLRVCEHAKLQSDLFWQHQLAMAAEGANVKRKRVERGRRILAKKAKKLFRSTRAASIKRFRRRNGPMLYRK